MLDSLQLSETIYYDAQQKLASSSSLSREEKEQSEIFQSINVSQFFSYYVLI